MPQHFLLFLPRVSNTTPERLGRPVLALSTAALLGGGGPIHIAVYYGLTGRS